MIITTVVNFSTFVISHFNVLKAVQLFHSSSKDLQAIVASVNVCLNSNLPGGKLNGLLALEVLVDDCSSQLFTHVMKKIDATVKMLQLIWSFLQKSNAIWYSNKCFGIKPKNVTKNSCNKQIFTPFFAHYFYDRWFSVNVLCIAF